MATPTIVPGDVLRRSIEILRAQFVLLYPIALVFGLVQAMVSFALQDTSAAALAAAVAIVSNALLVGIVVVATHEAETGTSRAEPSAGALLKAVAPIADKLLLVLLVTGVGVLGGLVLLIVPGLFLVTIWAVAAPVVVVERVGTFTALTRSRDLVAGSGWPVLITLLLTVLVLLPGALVAVGATALGSVGGSFVQVLFSAFVTVLGGIVATTMYHRLAAEEAGPPRRGAAGAASVDHGPWTAGDTHSDADVDDDRGPEGGAEGEDDGPASRPPARDDTDPVAIWSGGSRTGGRAGARRDDGASAPAAATSPGRGEPDRGNGASMPDGGTPGPGAGAPEPESDAPRPSDGSNAPATGSATDDQPPTGGAPA